MKNEEISALLSERIAAGDFPAAVYLVAECGEIRFTDALGLAVKTRDKEIAATMETVFDLASLTKVLITGLVAAKFIERGKLRLNDAVGDFFPAFKTLEKRGLTVRDLAAHVSGFAAWKPFYFLLQKWHEDYSVSSLKADALCAIAFEDLQNAVRSTVKYSDFNFLTLGFLLEQIGGASLDELARREIFEPLKLTNTRFNPPPDWKPKIAASEFGNEYERQTCLDMGYDVPRVHRVLRDWLIWGEVHDGNCWTLGGATGHAGLFADAGDICKIALQFLPASTSLLKAETCSLFKTNFTKNLNEARSFAFELAETNDSTASNALAKNSFGHLGFTGTSVWIEPDSERIFILLTNRTHRALPFVNINSTRRKFHELATDALNTL